MHRLLTRAECDWYPHHYRYDHNKDHIVKEEFGRSPARGGVCGLWLVRRRNVDRELYDPTWSFPVDESLDPKRGHLAVIRRHLEDDVVGHSYQFALGNGTVRSETRNDFQIRQAFPIT